MKKIRGTAALLLFLTCITPNFGGEGDHRPRCKVSQKDRVAMKWAKRTDCDGGGTVVDGTYNPTELYEIPVVVHVIYDEQGTGRLSEDKIHEMMTVLNQDFRAQAGTNAEQGNDVMIQFYLAEKDPQGNPSGGITYTQNGDWFREATEEIRAEYGSALAWDTTRYLNIFTTGMDFALGYIVWMPWEAGANPSEEGVAMAYDAVGLGGVPGADLGHTISHEVGHYLGLEHTFNSQAGDCATGDCYTTGDYICDTNPHLEADGGCADEMSCGFEDPIHNYMNYTDDSCLQEFTPEQINRMRCTLLTYRSGLIQNRTVAEAPTRWLTHVTRPGGDFTSTLYMNNRGTTESSVTLTAYASNGQAIAGATADLSVPAGGFSSMPMDNVFSQESLSHIGISGSDDIAVSVGYKAAAVSGATAHLNEDNRASTRWYFYPGEQDLVFDGLAVLNAGDAMTPVTVHFRDTSGRSLSSTTITESLAPQAKTLAIIGALYENPEGTVVEVSADQPVLIVALRGTQAGSGFSYLYQTQPIRGL
ncbi:MAG: zinc metalloprotease [Acidobacteriota bacterium]|nr:zinc metalloprotease [Acidobacteriota bacterium]